METMKHEAGTVVALFTNTEDNMQGRVVVGASGAWHALLMDLDSGNVVDGSIRIYPVENFDGAKAYARKVSGIDLPAAHSVAA
jgi:hypothetical protein